MPRLPETGMLRSTLRKALARHGDTVLGTHTRQPAVFVRGVHPDISDSVLISVICGVLKISVVGFAGLIAPFVALAGLIPLVGATHGAVVACIAAFPCFIPAGITAVIFFVLYQQLENQLLQPMIFVRTVKRRAARHRARGRPRCAASIGSACSTSMSSAGRGGGYRRVGVLGRGWV